MSHTASAWLMYHVKEEDEQNRSCLGSNPLDYIHYKFLVLMVKTVISVVDLY